MFTPESHQMVPLRSFSDFSIGEVFRAPARTITEGLFSAFQAASGDNAPLHYDREFLKRIGHEELYAHGFLTLIQSSIGATPLAHQLGENLIGFVEQSSKFLKQVYCGDTLYAEFEIKKLLLSKTTGIMVLSTCTYNQRSILVLTGTQKYLIKLS
ncbi:MAG: MaoC family dehydratase [Rhodobacterales bacterium]|jgi:acyl dehydratase|tara:strand:- start:2367 stop:2831 length:465 start_codon:yes stop_codon:yes gene_type:complete